MKHDWLPEAIANNAAWCHAVAASHGISGRHTESVWHSDQPMPPLYPNIITLGARTSIDSLIEAIDPQLSVGWGIKDSFSALALSSYGFAIAFEAQWYCCQPARQAIGDAIPPVHLQAVTSASDLQRWIAAWGEAPNIFNPLLLECTTVELMYLEFEGAIVAGLATNTSGPTIGISNGFGREDDLLGCIAAVRSRHPKRTIVGYGSAQELDTVRRLGFEAIGDLQVWLRQ